MNEIYTTLKIGRSVQTRCKLDRNQRLVNIHMVKKHTIQQS